MHRVWTVCNRKLALSPRSVEVHSHLARNARGKPRNRPRGAVEVHVTAGMQRVAPVFRDGRQLLREFLSPQGLFVFCRDDAQGAGSKEDAARSFPLAKKTLHEGHRDRDAARGKRGARWSRVDSISTKRCAKRMQRWMRRCKTPEELKLRS